MKRVLDLFVVFILLLNICTAYGVEQPRVQTATSVITGIPTDYGVRYMGIPYALPPVGELRWQPPVPADLPDVFDATEVGCSCPQLESTLALTSLPSVNEDCLYLNVYVPEKKIVKFKKTPVMVWFHGGSNMYGAGHAYDPAKLAERGVIVVTVNYRLGALGFLAHPALSTRSSDGVSGNYGIMDQQLALHWIQDNIDAFGGDPGNVTLFGQSAGGLSAMVHLMSPSSKGLFHRAIIQSAAQSPLKQPSLEEWEKVGMAIAENMGCSDQTIECLEHLSVETILSAKFPSGTTMYLPNVDGHILPRTTLNALLSGKFNRMPVMMGTTHDEISLMAAGYTLRGVEVTAENYIETMALLGLSSDVAETVAEEYPLDSYNSPTEAIIALGTDAAYSINAHIALILFSFRVKTFGYEFNDQNAPTGNLPEMPFPYGAYHASEIPYLMDVTLNEQVTFSEDQKALSNTMVGYWTSFAAFGTPNLAGEPFWPQYNALFQTMNSLEPPVPQKINDYSEDHHCWFWLSLFLK